MSRIWSRSEIDQLGQRLRRAATTDDLRLLDEYRRGFRDDYESLVAGIRSQARLEPSGRPAKSTLAILEKLRRSSARIREEIAMLRQKFTVELEAMIEEVPSRANT